MFRIPYVLYFLVYTQFHHLLTYNEDMDIGIITALPIPALYEGNRSGGQTSRSGHSLSFFMCNNLCLLCLCYELFLLSLARAY